MLQTNFYLTDKRNGQTVYCQPTKRLTTKGYIYEVVIQGNSKRIIMGNEATIKRLLSQGYTK